MADDDSDSKFSRRDFLEVSSGALAGAGVTSVANMFAQDQSKRPTAARVIRARQTLPSTRRIPIPAIRRRPTPAACRHSSIPSPSRTSGCIRADGPAKSPYANSPSPQLLPAWI